MDLNGILLAIANGAADGHTDAIYDALKRRQRVVSSIQLATIKVGDTVEFNSQCRPKYLQGVQGKVVKVNQTKVKVQMPDFIPGDTGRRFAGFIIDSPASLFTVVSQ